MKIAVTYCMIAMAFYALEIAVTDWKLTSISPRLLTLCYALGVAICAAVSLSMQSIEIKMPQGNQWIFVLLMIAASYIAASAHFNALTEQSGAVMLTMFYCLMPVAASLYMAIFKWELPSFRMVAAWLVAALALYLLSTSEGK